MIRPPACPACGAPTHVDTTGACLHCQAIVPFLTTGWLVSAIVSYHPSYALRRERFTQAMAANPDAFTNVPPGMRGFLQ